MSWFPGDVAGGFPHPLFNARRKIASCFVLIKLVYSSVSGKNRWWAPEEKPNPPSYLFSYLTIFNATEEVLASQIYQVLPLLSVCLCVCVFGRGGDHVSDPAEFWSLVSQWLLMTVRTLHSIKNSLFIYDTCRTEQSLESFFSHTWYNFTLFVNKGTNFSGKTFYSSL